MEPICVELEILKQGWNRTASGHAAVLSNADIQAIAASYDIKVKPAPVIIAAARPEVEGVVVGLFVEGGRLMAQLRLSPVLVSAIHDKRIAGLHVEFFPFEQAGPHLREGVWLSHIVIELLSGKATGISRICRRLASQFSRLARSSQAMVRRSHLGCVSLKILHAIMIRNPIRLRWWWARLI